MNLLARIIPFLMIGIAIVAFAFGLLLLTYLFIFGAAVGLILFAISWIRGKFFPNKTIMRTPPGKKVGRVINHDEK